MPTYLRKTCLAGLLGAFALGACAPVAYTPTNELISHDVKVAESIERLELYPNAYGFQLSERDRRAMLGFLANYAREGSGPIYMNTPATAGPGAAAAARDVQQALAVMGMSDVAVQAGRYPAAPGAPAPVVVSYQRLKTLVPRCDSRRDRFMMTGSNAPSPNWGCAHYANIAAMVADPNQFLEPYALDDPNMQRRMNVYERYIAGEVTGAAEDEGRQASSRETGG